MVREASFGKTHQIELLLLSCSNEPNNVTTDTD